jgi:hypothetical protein
MPLTPIGLNIPAGTDAFDPQVDFSDLAASLINRTIVPVANVTDRAAVATAIGPTATKPLVVIRANAPVYKAIEYTFDGTNWYALAESATLPDPVTATSPATTNTIVATAWAVLPGGDLTTQLVLVRPAWVHVEMSAWVVKTAASDLRAGVGLSGATVLAEEQPAWSQTLFAATSSPSFGGSITATKVVKFLAGTTTARMRAYLAVVAGTSQINYARITLTPLRWSD